MPRIRTLIYSAVILAALVLSNADAGLAYMATLNAGASDSTVKLGQRFTYTLIVIEEGETTKQTRLLTPDFGVFAVESSSKSATMSTLDGRTRRETRLSFTLSTDQPGEHRIGVATLRLLDPVTGVDQDMTSNEVVVTVLDETPGVMDEIRDIKEPRNFFDHVKRVFYMVLGLVALALIIVVALIVMLAKRFKPKPTATKAVPAMSPAEVALGALGLASRLTADPREFYSAVTDALRRFLKDTRGVHAVEATTSELVKMCNAEGMPVGQVDEIRGMFTEADLVKFAKHIPSEGEMAAYLARARSFVSGKQSSI